MTLDDAIHLLRERVKVDKVSAKRLPLDDLDIEALELVIESMDAFVDAVARSEATTVREKP